MRREPVTVPPGPPVFVYGTLRPAGRNHDRLLRGRTAWCEPARLPGAALYHGPGYPYALDGAPGDLVHGDLVQPLARMYDTVLAELDRLEEFVPGDPGSLYVRLTRDVLLQDGRATPAWVYLAGPGVGRVLRASGRRVAGGDWGAGPPG